MHTWWCALKTKHTSYVEVKRRKVIAQGWSALGNLVSLLPLVPDHRAQFAPRIQSLGDVGYDQEPARPPGREWWKSKDRKKHRTPRVMWNLLNLRKGDLVVAIEGTTVKGICQILQDGVTSYKYAGPGDVYEYAQTVGFPVAWVDWDAALFGFVPVAPAKSVLGIAGLVQDSAQVVSAWNKYVQSRT